MKKEIITLLLSCGVFVISGTAAFAEEQTVDAMNTVESEEICIQSDSEETTVCIQNEDVIVETGLSEETAAEPVAEISDVNSLQEEEPIQEVIAVLPGEVTGNADSAADSEDEATVSDIVETAEQMDGYEVAANTSEQEESAIDIAAMPVEGAKGIDSNFEIMRGTETENAGEEEETAAAEPEESEEPEEPGSALPENYTGVAQDPESGIWYYYKDGEIELNYTGIAEDPADHSWYRIKEGVVDFDYSGVAYRPENTNWYYIKNGKLDWGYTGIAQNPDDGSWCRVEKGRLNWDYTGVAYRPENSLWYYIKNGKLDWNYTGIAQNPAYGSWFRVESGRLNWKYTGVAYRPENTVWYYLKNGKLDWNYTGIAQNPAYGSWFRVESGRLNWKYTGVAYRPEVDRWYFIKKGKLDWNYTGIAENPANNKWYRVEKGKLNWGYTGGALRPENGNWYYIKNGRLDWTYTGLDVSKDDNKTYGYKDGKKVFGRTTLNGKLYLFSEEDGSLRYVQAYNKLDSIGRSLRNAYNWSVRIPYVTYTASGSKTTRYYANYGFSTSSGNCYVMAAVFCEMANALGYKASQITGSVPLASGGYGPHSWVEVVVDGTTYICDPDFGHETGRNGYLIHYGQSGTWMYNRAGVMAAGA